MNHDEFAFVDQWVRDAIAAAKHLSLCRYYTMRPSAGPIEQVAIDEVTATFVTTLDDFVTNRGGVIRVEICEGGQFEVTVRANDGVVTITPRRLAR